MKLVSLAPELSKFFDDVQSSFSERNAENRDSKASVSGERLEESALAVLATESMSAGNLLSQLALVSAGRFSPTNAELYPCLQRLVDQGQASFEYSGEERVYSITDEGARRLEAARAKASVGTSGHGDESAGDGRSSVITEKAKVLKAGVNFGQALSAVMVSGDPKVYAEASKIIEAANRKLYEALSSSK